MAKPSPPITFATNANFAVGNAADIGQPNKVAVPAGNIAEGFNPGFGMPAQWLNYLIGKLGEWSVWLDAFESTAHTWSALQTHSAGVEFDGGTTAESASNSDTNAVLQTVTAPTHKKLLYRFSVTSAIKGRVYADKDNSAIVEIVNGAYDSAGTTITTDDNASAVFMKVHTLSTTVWKYHAAAASFAEGSWTDVLTLAGSTGNLTATGAVQGATVVGTTSLAAQTARSSATGGAGQSVAAGIVYKDTTIFAWGIVHINPGGTSASLVRGANVASVAYTAAGTYDVTLQTAATNVLCPIVTPLVSKAAAGPISMTVDSADGTGPTTTTFRVLAFNATDTLHDVPGGGNEGFMFMCLQG